ncbi:MAG: exodeoxyribonuclease VII large subunit, partial [Actinomycetota bacterium]|nr:exodeoxyribonuclease VII large subunit [Actinomycetota bacterium]
GPMSQAEQFGAEQVRAEQRSLFVEEVPERTYGVGELAAGITRAVSAAFPAEIWVRGELSGLKPANASGHVYFSLSERSSRRGPTSTIGVALFRTDRLKVERFLRDWPGFALADGIEVRIRGRVQYAYGRISVVMSAVDPVHTLGRLAADRDRVLRALAADGLLEANGRLALPAMPLRVGLVTSAGSAACEDVLAELRASGFGFRVALADARVQGIGAEASLLRALRALSRRRVDVMVVVRGGGARTDLAAFDGERLARAVAAMSVPVVSGVGHEIDTSVVDEVAHTACKTPTACAALLVERVAAGLVRAEAAWTGVARVGRAGVAESGARLDRHAAAVVVRAGGALVGAESRLDARAGRVAVLARSRVAADSARLEAAVRRLDPARLDARLVRLDAGVAAAGLRVGRAGTRATVAAEASLESLAARTRAADPARALARGWSLTRRLDGRLVRRADELAPGEAVVTTFAHGRAASTVTEVVATSDRPGVDAL